MKQLNLFSRDWHHIVCSNQHTKHWSGWFSGKKEHIKIDKKSTECKLWYFFLLESTNLLIVNKIVSFWLFRFNINIYNMDAFMVCLLPFHESKIFIRAVQLLNLKSKTATKWDWLLPIQVNIWFFFTFSKKPAFILYSFKQKPKRINYFMCCYHQQPYVYIIGLWCPLAQADFDQPL